MLKGILSGMALRSGGAAGAGAACCWAKACPAATRPPARITACKIRDVIEFPPMYCGVYLAAAVIIEERKRRGPTVTIRQPCLRKHRQPRMTRAGKQQEKSKSERPRSRGKG